MVDSHSYCLTFTSLVRDRWDDLRPFTRTHTFRRHQIIYDIDDPPDAVFWIKSGGVKLVQVSADGQENILGLYRAGSLFGEVCICKGGARDHRALALGPLTVVSFSIRELLRILPRQPELTLELLKVFCARMVECQEQVATLAFDDVRTRLAKELVRLSRLPDARRERRGLRLPLSLTHQELASLVHTTRENVSMIMNEFRNKGLLEYGRGWILIRPQLQDYFNKFP